MTDSAKRLYHFTTKPWGLKSLVERRLKVCRYGDLNDPFELLPFDLSRTAHQAIWSDRVAELVAGDHGLLCFSDAWQSSEMWSRYAQRHAGLCLGFDVPAHLAEPMVYVDRPIAPPARFRRALRASSHATVEAALRFKPQHWRHENEWRLRVFLGQPADGIHYKEFDDELHLREVILGARCTLSASDVERAVGSPPLDVEIFQAQASLASFELHRHRETPSTMVGGFRARLARARDVYAHELPDEEPAGEVLDAGSHRVSRWAKQGQGAIDR